MNAKWVSGGNPNYFKLLKAQPFSELCFPSWNHFGLALHQAFIHLKHSVPLFSSKDVSVLVPFTYWKGRAEQIRLLPHTWKRSIKWNIKILCFLENSVILIIRKSWWSECSMERDLYDVTQWHAWATASGLCLCLSAGEELDSVTGEMSARAESRWARLLVKKGKIWICPRCLKDRTRWLCVHAHNALSGWKECRQYVASQSLLSVAACAKKPTYPGVWQWSSKKLFLCRHTVLPPFVSGIYLSSICLYWSIFNISRVRSTDAASCSSVVWALSFSNAHTATCDFYFCNKWAVGLFHPSWGRAGLITMVHGGVKC